MKFRFKYDYDSGEVFELDSTGDTYKFLCTFSELGLTSEDAISDSILYDRACLFSDEVQNKEKQRWNTKMGES